MNVTDQDVAALATTARHLTAAKMFSLACCVMLYFDILITFGDEVERIWKQRFTFATVLWFMNRYLSPLGYVVVIASFQMNWPKSVCERYVLYPEILKVFTAAAIGVIFILRLYSIYGGSMVILVSFSVLLVAELAVKIWAFTDGTSVNLPPGLVGCVLTGRGNSNDRFVFTWVAELVFDSIVFIATLSRTLIIYRRHRQGAAIPLIKIMMRDGIIYFLVIFIANVVTVVLFITLPPDLKAINASFTTLITSLMVSRLILNLRNQAMRPRANVMSYPSSSQQIHTDQEIQTQYRGLTSTVIGNLGQPVETEWFYEAEDDKDEKVPRERDESDRGRKDTYAMKNLKSEQNHTSSIMNGSALPVGQIVVEVTQTLSVTTDIHARTEEDASYPYAQPPPHSYPYPYPYRIDGDFRLSHGGGCEEATRNPDHPPSVFSHSLTTTAAQRALGVVGRTLRPGSSRSARSTTSASHASHYSRDQQYQQQHDNADANENYDERSSESGRGNGSGHGSGCNHRPYTSPPGTGFTAEGEAEREREDLNSGARAQAQARIRTTTATDTKARIQQRGDGGWRPPPTWMLENVDVYELGRPRRSGRSSAADRARRPSTS
ncbi:hypothetical protein ACEPAG_8940 [Sanghuangporus baumii]